MNLRRLFSKLSDKDLIRIHKEGDSLVIAAEMGYKDNGGIELGLARRLSTAREEQLVARAIGRERLSEGTGGSHKAFRGSTIELSPKQRENLFGKLLRRNRGIDRE